MKYERQFSDLARGGFKPGSYPRWDRQLAGFDQLLWPLTSG